MSVEICYDMVNIIKYHYHSFEEGKEQQVCFYKQSTNLLTATLVSMIFKHFK